MTFPYSFYIPVIGLSALVSMLLYFRKNIGYFTFFPPFLVISGLVEFFASKMAKASTNNALLYNIFMLVEISFFLFVMRNIIKNQRIKILIGYNIALYIFIKFMNFLLLSATTHHMITYCLGGLCIVAYCCYYFYQQVKQHSQTRLLLNPDFWICFGLAFFYTFLQPVYGIILFGGFLSQSYLIFSSFSLSCVNVILYSSFIIAFLCKLKLSKTNNA